MKNKFALTFHFLHHIFLCSCVLAIHNVAFAQKNSYPKKMGLNGYLGVAIGKESFLSILPPKIGIFTYLSFRKQEPAYHFSELKNAVYAGVDGSVGIIVSSYGFCSVFMGVKYGHFSMDNSIAIRSSFMKLDLGVKNNLITYNPKIGFLYKQIWFKIGPSFVVKHGLSHSNWMRQYNTYFNIDFNYLIKKKH